MIVMISAGGVGGGYEGVVTAGWGEGTARDKVCVEDGVFFVGCHWQSTYGKMKNTTYRNEGDVVVILQSTFVNRVHFYIKSYGMF